MKRMGSLPKACQTKKAANAEKWMTDCHKECIGKTRHWYIQVFAVSPDEQGKGYGREMFDFMMSVVDFNKVPAYLETFGPKNVRFYKKNGFEIKKKGGLEGLELHDGPVGMVRKAK